MTGPRPPARRRITIGGIGALVVAGLALTRFATADTAGDAAPPRRAAASAAELVSTLEDRVEADPENLRGWQDLAAAYLSRAAETGDPSYYDLTDRALGHAEELAPGQQETTVRRGALALARHQFADALALGTTATAAAPDSPDALVVLIDAQVELGRYDEAEASLTRLLDRRPGLAALSRLSYVQQLNGQTTAAVLTMQQAREAGESSPAAAATVSTFLGDLRLGQGDLDRADAAYRDALDRSPGLVPAELGRAHVLELQGRRPDAIDALERLTGRMPLPAALTLLGELQSLEGRDADAALTFDVVRAAYGSVVSAGGVVDLEQAVFEADHGDPVRAVELATAAHDARRTIYTADALSWALTQSGRPAEAVPFADEALRLGTEDAALHFHAATTFADAGQVDRARAELEAAAATGGPLPPPHRAAAGALATRLGVVPPALWSAG